MTTLSAQSIRKLCLDPQSVMIEPFHPRTKERGMSYGLGPAGYDVRSKQGVLVKRGGFVLISTIEHFFLPKNIQARVADKSTWARRCLAVQNTIFDPGYF